MEMYEYECMHSENFIKNQKNASNIKCTFKRVTQEYYYWLNDLPINYFI